MNGLGTKNRNTLIKSADDTEGGIFSIMIKILYKEEEYYHTRKIDL